MNQDIVDALVRAEKWEALTRYVASFSESAADTSPPRYVYNCWKCKKKMWEDSEDESTRIEKGYLRGYAKSMNFVHKNFFDQFHDWSCGTNDSCIGCCTCDGKIYYTIATCSDHSEELIKSISDKISKKWDSSTLGILEGMGICDCREQE